MCDNERIFVYLSEYMLFLIIYYLFKALLCFVFVSGDGSSLQQHSLVAVFITNVKYIF